MNQPRILTQENKSFLNEEEIKAFTQIYKLNRIWHHQIHLIEKKYSFVEGK